MTSTHEARHPVTLFTGQWADLPFDEVARRAAEWGYDGLEIAASGDHLDLRRADEDPAYLRSRLEVFPRSRRASERVARGGSDSDASPGRAPRARAPGRVARASRIASSHLGASSVTSR